MASAHDDNSLLSDQDTNQFLVYVGIEPQISYTTMIVLFFFCFVLLNLRRSWDGVVFPSSLIPHEENPSLIIAKCLGTFFLLILIF